MAELRLALTTLSLAIAMMLCTVIGVRQRVGIVLLVLLSFVWFTLDRDFEGDVIVRISSHNGLVTADLVGIAGVATAAWLWYRSRRR